jgi:hypothetical protein
MNLVFRCLFLALSFTTLLSLAGCGSEVCAACGAGGGDTSTSAASSAAAGPSCETANGTLTGTVTLFAAEGDPSSLAAPKALIELRRSKGDVPIQAMADEGGHFTVDINDGAWIVGGTSADGFCTTMMPKTFTVEACKSTTADVILEACVN